MMKYNGVPIDRVLMQRKNAEATAKIEIIKAEIDSITGGVNIGANASTAAFKKYLYETLGLPVLKTTEKNKEAADDAAMQMLKEWCEKHKPEYVRLFELVQEYRKWGKLKSTYIDGYLSHINDETRHTVYTRILCRSERRQAGLQPVIQIFRHVPEKLMIQLALETSFVQQVVMF